jgi:hypothetical protein
VDWGHPAQKWNPVASSCENDAKPSGFKKLEQLFNQLNNYHFK